MYDKNVNGYLTRKIFELYCTIREEFWSLIVRCCVMEPTLCFYHRGRNANLVNPALELSLKFCSSLPLEASELMVNATKDFRPKS